ncbi:MAG TPA: ABC transporter permease, partial [Candidatus Limnocylindrales bacterium]|nr:ABC transporter permease [Candidatus Limnocylindrales bacterium]
MSGRYLARRLASAGVTILLIVLLNFILFRAMPGSPERVLLGRIPNVTPQAIEGARERWGLDKPLFPDQFVAYVGSTLTGDLGFSYSARGRTVTEVLEQRLWPTLLLFGLGEVIAIVLGLALGAYSGWKRGGIVDLIGNGVSLVL